LLVGLLQLLETELLAGRYSSRSTPGVVRDLCLDEPLAVAADTVPALRWRSASWVYERAARPGRHALPGCARHPIGDHVGAELARARGDVVVPGYGQHIADLPVMQVGSSASCGL